jgi:hypothetical protein
MSSVGRSTGGRNEAIDEGEEKGNGNCGSKISEMQEEWTMDIKKH